ncbi:hypothetical protein Pmani_006733 [Petrolisthes manimaculis]|uniref:Uncharacterized protein n=1 Tax=Petrolisthes manimaculis TaxID=1843537 RepID=A0AAE1Q9R0_9EUCA|nr:hypothetical protein Pmani_006733 [Petrolisthes manimaculis]
MCNFYLMYWVEGEPQQKKYCFTPGPPFYHWSTDTRFRNFPKDDVEVDDKKGTKKTRKRRRQVPDTLTTPLNETPTLMRCATFTSCTGQLPQNPCRRSTVSAWAHHSTAGVTSFATFPHTPQSSLHAHTSPTTITTTNTEESIYSHK